MLIYILWHNGVFLVVYRLSLSLFISLDTIYDDLGREDGTSDACVWRGRVDKVIDSILLCFLMGWTLVTTH